MEQVNRHASGETVTMQDASLIAKLFTIYTLILQGKMSKI